MNGPVTSALVLKNQSPKRQPKKNTSIYICIYVYTYYIYYIYIYMYLYIHIRYALTNPNESRLSDRQSSGGDWDLRSRHGPGGLGGRGIRFRV